MEEIELWWFQCSSASRKFLNAVANGDNPRLRIGFSALQRAENSSIRPRVSPSAGRRAFQCSSASRKFLNSGCDRRITFALLVSVLFSEPKIPQCAADALGREERPPFQCSSASRKFLNQPHRSDRRYRVLRFSALQRAENSSMLLVLLVLLMLMRFSALQRAENSSIFVETVNCRRDARFQCSSASRKFLNRKRGASLVQLK